MAINELIAQGVRPIGADLPQVANMLQQRQHQQFQNALATQQNDRAQGEYDLTAKKYQAEQLNAQDDHFRQGFGYLLQQLEKVKDDPERYRSSLSAIEQSPNFRQGQDWAARNGVDLKELDNPQNIDLVRAKAGIAPTEGKYQVVRDSLVQTNAPGGPRAVFEAQTPETMGQPQAVIGSDGKPVLAQFGNRGGRTVIAGMTPAPKDVAGTPAANVTVNADKSFYTTLGEQRAKAISDLYDQAQKAPQVIQQSALVRNLLQSGSYTGTGAEFKLQLGKAARTIGIDYAGDDIANTEVLVSQLGQATLDAIKSSGLGAGQGFTDKDRQFLQAIVGGSVSLDKATLMRLATLHDRAARETIRKWNDTSKGLDQNSLKSLGMNRLSAPSVTGEDPTVPVKVSSPDEALKLPPGTIFVTPDGRVKTVPGAQ